MLYKSISRREKAILIVDDLYIYNYITFNKSEKLEVYNKEYKSDFCCPAFIKLNNNEIKYYNNKHNHRANHLTFIYEELRKKIKEEIKKDKDPFALDIHKIYKSISVDKGIKAPSFCNIKTTLYNEVNKNLPKDILNLKYAPTESIYYKTLDNENYVLYKDNHMIILQSPKLAKIHMKLCSIIFCDATFFVCPSFAYQLFIRRVFSSITNSYYSTLFTIMDGKKEIDYIKIFNQINEHLKLYLDINETYEVKEIHQILKLS